MLLLPGDPLFEETLEELPPDWLHLAHSTNGAMAIIKRLDGLLESVSWQDATEYLYGGEYDLIEWDI